MSEIDIADSDEEMHEEPHGDILEEIENEPVENNQAEEDDENQEDDEQEKKKVKPKRVIRNPRLKFDAELLKGPKGLGVLEQCFQKVKFKGKGHEEADLNLLLKTYEYWCHRLYPKFPFQNSIEKIEKLGSKGPIQTYLKKVRSGMIDEEIQPSNEILPEFRSDDEETEPQPISESIIEDIPIELTEEQIETIRRNREKAEKLRQERLQKIQEKGSMNLPESSRLKGSSTSKTNVLDEANSSLASSIVELEGQHNVQEVEDNQNSVDDQVIQLVAKQSNLRNRFHDSDEDQEDEVLSSVSEFGKEIPSMDIVSSELTDNSQKNMSPKNLSAANVEENDLQHMIKSRNFDAMEENTSDSTNMSVLEETMVGFTKESTIRNLDKDCDNESISTTKECIEKSVIQDNCQEFNKENERLENMNVDKEPLRTELVEDGEDQMKID